MTDKGGILKKEINQTTNGDILLLVERKIDFFMGSIYYFKE